MKKNDNTKKKKIIKYILIIILFIITILFISNLIHKHIMKINDEKIINNLQELKNEEVNYVFVEINPKFVFEVKNDEVISVGCLNDDCMEIYDELNVVGKSLIDSVDYIYNYVKEKKYNLNTVKVKVLGNFSFVSDKKYINVEIIDEEEKEQLLNDIINNDQIKEQTSKEQYNIKLWNELKKDKDYGNIYDCVLSEEELECYIKKNLRIGFGIDKPDITKYLTQYDNIIPNLDGISRVLNKFGLKTKSETELGLFRNPIFSIYVDDVEYVSHVEGENYLSEDVYYNVQMNCNTYEFNLTSINLLKINEIKQIIHLDKDEEVFEESTYETIIHQIKDDVYGKKQIRKSRNYCENNTIKGELSDDIYIIYRIDGSSSEEVSKEVYEDFNTSLGEYMSNIPLCEYETINQDGEVIEILKKPANGKYCKSENNSISYYYE